MMTSNVVHAITVVFKVLRCRKFLVVVIKPTIFHAECCHNFIGSYISVVLKRIFQQKLNTVECKEGKFLVQHIPN